MKRLADQPRRDELARLLAAQPALEPLGPTARARIRAAVDDALARRSRLRLVALLATIPALALVLFLALPRPSAPALSRTVAPGATLDGESRHTLAADGSVRLESGTLVVTTRDRAITIRTPHGRVTIPERSRVRILVNTRLQVAAFVGNATVEQAGGATQTILPERPEPVPPSASGSPPVRPPVRAPVPARVPARVDPDDAVTLLGRALSLLRVSHDPAAALRVLDDLAVRHPSHALDIERRVTRIDALVALHDHAGALAELDALDLSATTRPNELRLLRAELRASAGRCADALPELEALAAGDGAHAERAHYGAANCLARLGDHERASDALHRYLARFPSGRFTTEVRRALGL